MKNFLMTQRRENFKGFGLFPARAPLDWIEGTQGFKARQAIVGDGSTLVFLLSAEPSVYDPVGNSASSVQVYKNGLLLNPATAFVVSKAGSGVWVISFTVAPLLADTTIVYVF